MNSRGSFRNSLSSACCRIAMLVLVVAVHITAVLAATVAAG
jgi:hypothetical protein